MSGPDRSERRAIIVRVLFFGPLAESLGEREVEIPLELGTTIAQLIERLGLDDFVSGGLRVAIDGNLVNEFDSAIKDSSELAFLPPVSGG
ncbi:MAG: MoaD/ThiS family protein [Candidatus Thermoplasmatota archaeon]|nr:MoaD/ThiS family protein [Candidatus Thermoplasmatota archaeon]MEC9200309.1 MoaD/ThiS family protein [Candidatus Thermoplasmatota archaeon]MEE2626209.1 MoaD/ThiS family protein [Candidatus Thermoplasmatota archaeon]